MVSCSTSSLLDALELMSQPDLGSSEKSKKRPAEKQTQPENKHARSVAATVSGGQKTRGRPVNRTSKHCGICHAADDEDDPTQVEYSKGKDPDSGDMRNTNGKLAIRWLYPRRQGLAQGICCYYCGKTAELLYPQLTLKEIHTTISQDVGAEKKSFSTSATSSSSM